MLKIYTIIKKNWYEHNWEINIIKSTDTHKQFILISLQVKSIEYRKISYSEK